MLSGCGGGTPAGSGTTTTTAGGAGHFTYGPTPSVSALQICHEAVGDIAADLGVTTVTQPTASWVHHRYTCTYRYTDATMVLWVQELPSLRATTAYMTGLKRTMGDVDTVVDVGQGAFATTNGSAVSRKDNKVLVVDVAGLPAMFGRPATTRAEVALSVTEVVFACWRGD